MTADCGGWSALLGGPLDKLIRNHVFSGREPSMLAADHVSGLELPMFVLAIRIHGDTFIEITAKVRASTGRQTSVPSSNRKT